MTPQRAPPALDSTDVATATAAEAPPPAHEVHHAAKKRKPTYLVRKEEAQVLQSQVQALQAEVKTLQSRAELADLSPLEQQRRMWVTITTNSALKEAVHGQHLVVAGAQALIKQHQENRPSNPLYTHIRLPKAWDARRRVLLGLKDDVLSRAWQYVAARSEPLDLRKTHFSDERYEDAMGSFCCERFEFIPFVGATSVQQVFAGVRFFLDNMEISISESLGHTTVREDYDSVEGDACVSNYRLVSGNPNGVTSEINTVAFVQYFQYVDELGGPCALMVTDSVDMDDLYPYNPHERVRRDVSAAIVLREVLRKRRTHTGEEVEERVVVMQRAAFVKVYRPQFPVPLQALQTLQEGIASWGDVMVQTIRSFVSSHM